MASGKVRKTSRATRTTSNVSLDEQGRPQFGLQKQIEVSNAAAPRQRGSEKMRASRYSLEEHIAYMKVLGYDPIMIPGTPERRALLERFIADYHGYEPAHKRQLESWQRELAGLPRISAEPVTEEVPDV